MRRYPAGTHVQGGLYLNPLTGQVAVVPRQGGVVRGTEGFYVRLPVPPALGLLLAPLAGALYVIVLPFVGLALLAVLLCRKVWAATGAGEALTALFAGDHGRPGWAFLSGRRRRRKGSMRTDRHADAGAAPGDRQGKEDG